MMWDSYEGWSFFWMVPTMLFGWAMVILLTIGAVSVVTRWRENVDPAIETLRRRLATGEISQDEFDKTRRLLRG
jgi:uncharacterized membrane protein